MEQKLTDKQERFVDEYCIDFNATRAAKAAGYSEKSASVEGVRLLGNVKIESKIEKKKQELADKCLITKQEIIEKLINIAETAKPTQQIRAYEVINKMLGHNATERQELTIKEQPLFTDEGTDEL